MIVACRAIQSGKGNAMGQTVSARIGMAMLVASASWSGAADADPVTYACASNAHSGMVFVRLDEKLKTVSMGRSEDGMLAPDSAIFTRDTVTWSHMVEKGLDWDYTFVRATGALTYGPAKRGDLAQQDLCKKK
jgi:hypothetical protein